MRSQHQQNNHHRPQHPSPLVSHFPRSVHATHAHTTPRAQTPDAAALRAAAADEARARGLDPAAVLERVPNVRPRRGPGGGALHHHLPAELALNVDPRVLRLLQRALDGDGDLGGVFAGLQGPNGGDGGEEGLGGGGDEGGEGLGGGLAQALAAAARAQLAAAAANAGADAGGWELEDVVPPEPPAAAVAQLSEMGFGAPLVRKALLLSRNSVDLALEWLLQHGEEPGADEPPTQEQLRAVWGARRRRRAVAAPGAAAAGGAAAAPQATAGAGSAAGAAGAAAAAAAPQQQPQQPQAPPQQQQQQQQQPQQQQPPVDEAAVAMLTDMGFAADAATRALRRFGGSVDLAVAYLLGGGGGGGDAAPQQAAAGAPAQQQQQQQEEAGGDADMAEAGSPPAAQQQAAARGGGQEEEMAEAGQAGEAEDEDDGMVRCVRGFGGQWEAQADSVLAHHPSRTRSLYPLLSLHWPPAVAAPRKHAHNRATSLRRASSGSRTATTTTRTGAAATATTARTSFWTPRAARRRCSSSATRSVRARFCIVGLPPHSPLACLRRRMDEPLTQPPINTNHRQHHQPQHQQQQSPIHAFFKGALGPMDLAQVGSADMEQLLQGIDVDELVGGAQLFPAAVEPGALGGNNAHDVLLRIIAGGEPGGAPALLNRAAQQQAQQQQQQQQAQQQQQQQQAQQQQQQQAQGEAAGTGGPPQQGGPQAQQQ